MQVVAYKALDGKLFEFESDQIAYDKKYLEESLMRDLAITLVGYAPFISDLDYQAITDEGHAYQALKALFQTKPDQVIKAVKALSGK